MQKREPVRQQKIKTENILTGFKFTYSLKMRQIQRI